MSEKKYSWSELVVTSNDIDGVLKQQKEQKEQKEDDKPIKSGIDRILAFKLRSNQKKANSAIELLEEEFPEKNEAHDEYLKKKIEIARDFDGEIQELNGRVMVTNYNEISQNKEFLKKIDLLDAENSEVVDAEAKRQKDLNKLRNEKTGSIDWASVNLEYFPKEISGEDLPLSFIEFVKFEEQ